jgi:hypothetical protein
MGVKGIYRDLMEGSSQPFPKIMIDPIEPFIVKSKENESLRPRTGLQRLFLAIQKRQVTSCSVYIAAALLAR